MRADRKFDHRHCFRLPFRAGSVVGGLRAATVLRFTDDPLADNNILVKAFDTPNNPFSEGGEKTDCRIGTSGTRWSRYPRATTTAT